MTPVQSRRSFRTPVVLRKSWVCGQMFHIACILIDYVYTKYQSRMRFKKPVGLRMISTEENLWDTESVKISGWNVGTLITAKAFPSLDRTDWTRPHWRHAHSLICLSLQSKCYSSHHQIQIISQKMSSWRVQAASGTHESKKEAGQGGAHLVFSALRKQGQEDHESKASQSYRARFCL